MNTTDGAIAATADPVWVKIAAADSLHAAKDVAEFVCHGEHDEKTLQAAIDRCAADGRDLFLFDGIYHVDAFREWGDGGPRAAIRIPRMLRHFTIRGQKFFQAGRGTISMFICDTEHPARCVDLRWTDAAEVRNMRLYGFGYRAMNGDSHPWKKFGLLPMPHIDAIGLTMTSGSNIPVSRFDNIVATGFGQGFETVNLAHRRVGPSEERRRYAPHLGQTYFDTDLGKLLVCTDPAKRVWVDAMGKTAERLG